MAVLALGGQSAGLNASLPEWLRFGIAFVTLVWLPGVFALQILRPRLSWSGLRLPLSFFLGASLLAVLASVVMAFGGTFGLFRALVQLMAGLLFVFAMIRRRGVPAVRVPRAVAILVVSLGVMVAFSPSHFDFAEDAYDHIGYLRHIASENSLEPGGVLAEAVDGGEAVPDPRKGAFHAVVAAVSSVANTDPMSAWAMLPVIIFPLSFVAFIGFCRPFVERRWQLYGCAILFGLSYGGIGFQFAETSAYGQNLAVAWYWLLVGLILGNKESTSRRELVVIAMLVAGGVLTHLGVALHAAILTVSIVLFPSVFSLDRKSAMRLGATIGATVAIVGGWKFAHTYAPANDLHLHQQGLLFWGKLLVTANPAEIIRHHGMLFFGGLVAAPAMLFFARRQLAKRHLVIVLIPFAASFVPWIATPLFGIGSYMVFRSLLGIPVFALILVLTRWLFGKARGGRILTKVGVAAVVAVWTLTFVSPTLRAVSRGGAGRGSGPAFVDTHRDLVRYLNTLPEGSVILSDPKTSYALSAMTSHEFVAIHGQHATPGDALAMVRLRAVRDALSPFTMAETTIEACDRFDVDMVVINGRTRTKASEFLSLWDSSFFAFTVSKMIGISGRFRETFKADGIVVFLYDSAGTGEIKWSPPMAPFAREAAGATRCVVDAPDRDFSVTSVAVEPNRLLPGEEIIVTIGYEKYDATDFGFPMTLHLRFEHESLPEVRRYPGEKHVRHFEEQRARRLRRFRRDFTPYQGTFPVELWPIGVEFYERVVVKIPAVMETGSYRVEISIDRETLLPNLEIGDFLYDRDHFSGKTCARFELVRSLVR